MPLGPPRSQDDHPRTQIFLRSLDSHWLKSAVADERCLKWRAITPTSAAMQRQSKFHRLIAAAVDEYDALQASVSEQAKPDAPAQVVRSAGEQSKPDAPAQVGHESSCSHVSAREAAPSFGSVVAVGRNSRQSASVRLFRQMTRRDASIFELQAQQPAAQQVSRRTAFITIPPFLTVKVSGIYHRRLPEGSLAEGVSDLIENRSFWGSGRPRGTQKPLKNVGSWAARDRPEPQNDRFSIKSLTPLC